MANNKMGLSYYNIDTDRYIDIRIKRLKKDFGCNGIAVYDYILCNIYRDKGCFLAWDESTAFDVADYFGLKESLIEEIVKYCGVVGLFDKGLLSRGILSSQSIQKRYIEMCKRAKRNNVEIPEEYNILPEECLKIPEELIKKEEVCRKESKESKVNNPPYIPPRGNEGEIFDLSSLSPPEDGTNRNFPGLVDFLNKYPFSVNEKKKIIIVTNYGEVGHPIWQLFLHVAGNREIKMPDRFIISKLKL